MHASRERRAQSMYVNFCFVGKGMRRKPEPGHGSLGSQARATLLMSPQGHAMIWCWSLARWGAWLPARCWMSRLLICRLDSKMGRAADITDQVRIHHPWQYIPYAGSLVKVCSFGALPRHPVSMFALNQPSNNFAHVKKRTGWSWIVRVKRKMETNKTDDHLCLSWCCVFRIADFICVFDVFAYDGLFIICICIYIYTLRLPCPQYARGFAYVMCWHMWYENTLFLISLPSSLYLRYMTTCSLFPLPSHRWVSRFLRVCESAHFWLSKSL